MEEFFHLEDLASKGGQLLRRLNNRILDLGLVYLYIQFFHPDLTLVNL